MRASVQCPSLVWAKEKAERTQIMYVLAEFLVRLGDAVMKLPQEMSVFISFFASFCKCQRISVVHMCS